MMRLAPVLVALSLLGAAAAAAKQPSTNVAHGGGGDEEAWHGKMENAPLPVVIWHGMGDWCCGEHSMGAISSAIQSELGVYVHSVSLGGGGEGADVWHSYFGDVNAQVALVCAAVAADERLQGGYNAVGFSQGGQFMRAVAQRCQGPGLPRMHTLITFGGQHQGIMNVPSCAPSAAAAMMTPAVHGDDNHSSSSSSGSSVGASSGSSMLCRLAQALVDRGAYLPWVRASVVQAQYFKDPGAIRDYLRYNPFLPDLNNELAGGGDGGHDDDSNGDGSGRAVGRNATYAENLASLDRLVLFKWEDDGMVEPCESAWFGVWSPEERRVLGMNETVLYQEDWIGLRSLDEGGRLELRSLPGAHMHLGLEWFKREVVHKYLAANYPPPPAAKAEGEGSQGQGRRADASAAVS